MRERASEREKERNTRTESMCERKTRGQRLCEREQEGEIRREEKATHTTMLKVNKSLSSKSDVIFYAHTHIFALSFPLSCFLVLCLGALGTPPHMHI